MAEPKRVQNFKTAVLSFKNKVPYDSLLDFYFLLACNITIFDLKTLKAKLCLFWVDEEVGERIIYTIGCFIFWKPLYYSLTSKRACVNALIQSVSRIVHNLSRVIIAFVFHLYLFTSLT